MAEDQGKEEEKFDFTGEGEAVNYISMPQAVVRARRLARENDERYKERFGWGEVVWTELRSETIGEDYYRVVLQFSRPQRGILEEQTGEEEFLFDFTGTLLDRQVLLWPEGSDPASDSALTPEPTSPSAIDRGEVTPSEGHQYICEDCGHVFQSRTARNGPKYCGGSVGAPNCAGARRRNGMGRRQADPAGPNVRDLTGTMPLAQVLEMCRQMGEEIYIGYSGGGAALRQTSGEHLRSIKTWGWRNPRSDGRVADPENWIPATSFLAIVQAKL